MFDATSDASRRENAAVCLSAVMPRFMRGIQYAAVYALKHKHLWNTGLPVISDQVGDRRRATTWSEWLFEN
jgi:hypothetical protein